VTAPPATGTRGAGPPLLGPERPVTWPRRARHRLANGLEVVLAESRVVPKVAFELVIRSGDAAVADERPGLAQMTAAVVRAGTSSRSIHQIEEELRRIGAELGTSAGADSSAISISGLSEFAEQQLALLADLACNASFPAAEFERQRRQSLEELRIARTTPGFLAGERLRRVLFGEHPYAIASPTEEQVREYQRDHLESYYHAHYRPANALLLAVGDLDAQPMLERIEKIFGAWPSAEVVARSFPSPPETRGRRVHLVHLADTVQTQILVGNRTITRSHPEWLRLALANAILGGAFHSRLVLNIREQKGYTYSPRSVLHALRQHGYFDVHAAVRKEVVAATLAEIFYEVERMRALPVADAELEETANYLCGTFSLGLATQAGMLGQLATVYLFGLSEDYLETYRQQVREVTVADVLAAARAWFDSPNMPIVLVGDRSQIREQAALYGEVTVYDNQGKVIGG